jgi:RHS repeat-associated protein
MKVITAAGAVANSYTYDPYGTTTAATGSLLEPFRYTGAYTDQTTGLIKLGARYYDPTLGRFTQTDPQTHPDDVNQASPYPYAGNDPINYTDPTGTFSLTNFVVGTLSVLAGGFALVASLPMLAACPLVAPCVGGIATALGGLALLETGVAFYEDSH